MGLDAVVFCDCVEKGKLKNPHPFPKLLYIAENGAPEIRSKSDIQIELHDNWMKKACRHEGMMIDGAELGNANAIEYLQSALRQAVKAFAREFPVLWKKVIYSGTHTGDHLSSAEVRSLDQEMKRFGKIDFKGIHLNSDDLKYVRAFEADMVRLIKTALKARKPIAF